jgi:hypothetical protein
VQVADKTPIWASGAAFIPLNIADCETVVPTRAPEKGHKDALKNGVFVLLPVRKNPAETAELRPSFGSFIILYQ